jgi:flagellar protein FlbT
LLREKNILKEEEANTPGRRIYFVIQLMYIDEENLTTHHKTYWELVSVYSGGSQCSGHDQADQ